ncbi:uncharacterized protein SPAPADRAFT_62704 [Spathaspora passalidarum NRRL Y-27907]|uniref:Uncharacterized protein n=1 Tax=Spathaspora passalidarum (strain NRRL Y-27907 / 11-Y1) TaxID=619300 RepID=G3AT74_SPAPN|nr:uncharacterized protein SPAPADRAFT_62704 [Spathaspora passalidarum NRRL Y-27907]EGW30837.1 hypothetical protein SPAPADRAFT_62704 [Spathaspora passalidarum NRRL Y-27907]
MSFARSKRIPALVVVILIAVVTLMVIPYSQGNSSNLKSIGHSITQQLSFSQSQSTYKKIEHQDKAFQVSTVVYEKESSDNNKHSVLILSSIGSGKSYGGDRDFSKFLDVVRSIVNVRDSSKYEFSLGVQCNDENEFSVIKNAIDSVQDSLEPILSRIILVSAPKLEDQIGLSRGNRHNPKLQRLRRRLIAKSRNFLWTTALKNEQYIFFMDADMISLTENMVEYFVESDKDIVVPRVDTAGGIKDYDKNSWRGQRTKPTQKQLDLMDAGKWNDWDYVPHDVNDQIYHFSTFLKKDLVKHKGDLTYKFPLDSVGGAVLFAKSMVFKQGAIFPTSNIIGTTWDRSEGYDGIETEGLCYLAKPLGFSCWGMPNLVATHI